MFDVWHPFQCVSAQSRQNLDACASCLHSLAKHNLATQRLTLANEKMIEAQLRPFENTRMCLNSSKCVQSFDVMWIIPLIYMHWHFHCLKLFQANCMQLLSVPFHLSNEMFHCHSLSAKCLLFIAAVENTIATSGCCRYVGVLGTDSFEIVLRANGMRHTFVFSQITVGFQSNIHKNSCYELLVMRDLWNRLLF